MKAFLNDKAVKEKYLSRVLAHRKADEIIRGRYWENGKGCAVGCTIHSSDHSAYEKELGIPEWLAQLEDRLFEGMPLAKAKLWPERFLNSINVGSDLEKIKAPFLIFVLQCSLKNFDHEKYPKVVQSIKSVIDLHTTGKATQNDFRKARDAAAADADADADAAAAAAYADASAYAAYAAVRKNAYLKLSNHLIKLLKAQK